MGQDPKKKKESNVLSSPKTYVQGGMRERKMRDENTNKILKIWQTFISFLYYTKTNKNIVDVDILIIKPNHVNIL